MQCRSDFEVKLLLLFCDSGLEALTESQVLGLASLLPAIAAMQHEGQVTTKRLLMSSSSMDFEALQQFHKSDAQLVKVWPYILVVYHWGRWLCYSIRPSSRESP